jgi:hypothetical protein
MNVEQRLIEAFESTAPVEPTADLFARVVHSIEEDRRHRQRVVRTAALLAVTAIAVTVIGALSIKEGPRGDYVRPAILEVLEIAVLVLVLAALGPAIRRFGRNYAADLWPSGAATPSLMLRLLDLAYSLVGAGYVLLSTEFDFDDGPGLLSIRLADQLGDASVRVGGLLLVLGLLHATLLSVLPLIALIDNSTRRGAPLARWVILLLVLVGLAAALIAQMAVGIALSG